LQTGFRVGPRIIATGRTLIANGIAIIGIVPMLIATGPARGGQENDPFFNSDD
jgi:hypothetical protein